MHLYIIYIYIFWNIYIYAIYMHQWYERATTTVVQIINSQAGIAMLFGLAGEVNSTGETWSYSGNKRRQERPAAKENQSVHYIYIVYIYIYVYIYIHIFIHIFSTFWSSKWDKTNKWFDAISWNRSWDFNMIWILCFGTARVLCYKLPMFLQVMTRRNWMYLDWISIHSLVVTKISRPRQPVWCKFIL